MRKNYFAKLMNYMKNVYSIDRLFNKLEDLRVNPKQHFRFRSRRPLFYQLFSRFAKGVSNSLCLHLCHFVYNNLT